MKKKMYITIAIICLALLAAAAVFVLRNAQDQTPGAPLALVTSPSSRAETEPDEDFLAAVNDFAYASTAAVLADTAENANFSPLSLYYALSLAATGAEGDTAAEFMDVLGVSDAEELSAQCESLYRQLYIDGGESKLTLANSLWMSKRLSFRERFVQNAAANFYAHSFSVDFNNTEKTKQIMTDWVAEHTNQTIEPSLDVSSGNALVILNTIYFFDKWAGEFEEYKTHEDEFFTTPDAAPILCDFMHRTDSDHAFARGDGFTRSSISLLHGGSMVFVLPDEGISVHALLADEATLRNAFQGGGEGEGEVIWSIPKFDFTSRFTLNNAIQRLGIQSAFVYETANFQGISDSPMYIDGILQGTSVSINEYGVEAGAYTEVTMLGIDEESPDDVHMNLNRPFLYGITAPNGTLLFIGVCMNPAS